MKVKMGQAFDLQMGKTPSRNVAEYWGGEHKWVSIADIGNAGKYISETKECITDEGISGSGIKIVPKGTVIMSFKLSIGKTAIASEDMYTNEAIMAFIDKGVYPVDPNYLYHLCCGTDWTAGTNKAVMGLTLNKATLSDKKINLPTIQEQKEIAEKLDNVDSLINLRQQELAKLDEFVKSRFIEMFGNPLLNEMKWPVQKMKYVAPSTPYSGKVSSNDNRYWLLNLDMVESNTGRIIDKVYVPMDKIGLSTTTFSSNYVLFSKLRPYLNKVVIPDDSGYATTELIPMLPEPQLLKQVYLAQLLRGDQFLSFISTQVSGTKMPRVTMSVFWNFEVMLPPLELQEQFAVFVRQSDKSKLAVKQSLEKLETLKKSLMQKYFG